MIGSIALRSMNHWDEIKASRIITINLMKLYVALVMRVLDRQISTTIGGDSAKAEILRIVFAFYFMISLAGRTPSADLFAMVMKEYARNATRSMIEDFMVGMNEANGFTSLETFTLPFIDFLDTIRKSQGATSWLSRINVRGFINQFATSYAPIALFALEDLQVMLEVFITHTVDGELTPSYTLEPLIKPAGALDEVSAELLRIFKR